MMNTSSCTIWFIYGTKTSFFEVMEHNSQTFKGNTPLDFEETLWTAEDIDALGALFCKYAHRFSKHSTDLGRVTVDPFRIILKKDAQPVRQRPYRHSPVLAAK